ncbi:MAG: aminopeptidase [bacterium]
MDKIEQIYKINLDAKDNENILIISDCFNNEISETAILFRDVGKNLKVNTNLCLYPPLLSHGEEPPENVWKEAGFKIDRETFERIKRKEPMEIDILNPPDILISITNFSTSHTSFRKLLTKNKTRYVSMPLFEKSMLYGALDVDYEKMNNLGERIKAILEKGENVRVSSPSGTELMFNIKEREITIDNGLITKKGDFGNLPAGEVFLPPIEGSCNGVLVIEVMEKRRLKSPLFAKIENGMVVSVDGEIEAKQRLEGIFSKYPLARNIAELGIGINDKASNPINILEAEKIKGTGHIAFGDNSGFGGNISVPFHEDYVVFSPTIEIDGKTLKI